MSIETIKQHVIDFCNALDIPFSSITLFEAHDHIVGNVIPLDQASLYIGYRGQNLAAMQHLLRALLWEKGLTQDQFFVLDIDGYQEKNNNRIFEILEQKIQLVEKTGSPQLMPFLQPLERRMVHVKIKNDFPLFESESFDNQKGERVLRILKK